MLKPYLRHLKSSGDLKTTYEAVRAGFVALALEKNRRATPHIAEAQALSSAARKAKAPAELLKIADIQAGLLTAAGISDKAAGYLRESDKREAIDGLIKNFLEPAGVRFVEELVFRFLLIRGDTLGGSMRNIGGFMAQKKLTRALLAHLRLSGLRCHWLHKGTGNWVGLPTDNSDVELSLRGLSWLGTRGPRTLLYNINVPLVKNNIDLTLLNFSFDQLSPEIIRVPTCYIALGELKGGIDPAGADEHWKTARTALERIHRAFTRKKLKPNTFFIGAAIEAKMAAEIWEMLERGELENAANLTSDDHIASVASWLCNL